MPRGQRVVFTGSRRELPSTQPRWWCALLAQILLRLAAGEFQAVHLTCTISQGLAAKGLAGRYHLCPRPLRLPFTTVTAAWLRGCLLWHTAWLAVLCAREPH